MRALGFLLLFAVLGLVVGYAIYGRARGEYVPPAMLMGRSENLTQAGIALIYGLENRREKILVSGAVGAIVGLFMGVFGAKKKPPASHE